MSIEETKTPGIEVQPGIKAANKDVQMLWKRRYETSCQFYKNVDDGQHKTRTENVIRYLHNDFSTMKGTKAGIVFLNQFFIGLKTLIPMVVAHNPFVSVSADNDIVFEYDENGDPITGPDGQPIQHDISKAAGTIQAFLKKNLEKKLDFRTEIRSFLRDSITFNRGIYLVGHTLNSEYSGAFNTPAFHPYLKSVMPNRIKRQAGTTRIDEGTYFFYEYELPVSHVRKNNTYDQTIVSKCRQEILAGLKFDDTDEYLSDSNKGYYDDVKFIKMYNAYDLLTGEVLVFGAGADEPLKSYQPDYSFKNPSVEFIPNELFQPDQKEPVSDLMMGESIVRNAQTIVEKAVEHVKKFNTGIDVERGALVNKKDRDKILKGFDRSIRVWENGAISGGKMRPHSDISIGAEPINMVEYLFGYFQKMIAVYDFQQGGRPQDEETATKTQAKLQTSQFKGGDMSEMFSDACNKAVDKYLEVFIKTTSTKEIVKVVGDAGEVEYRAFNKDEANKGQFYCTIDLQSMGKANDDVKTQQALKFYEIVKSDPDVQVQQRVDKVALIEKLAKGLGLGNDQILRKVPDTKGMDEQNYREYLKQQMLKAKQVSEQILAGASPLPPTPDDDDDIHITEYLSQAQKLRSEAASNPDQLAQQQAQVKIQGFVQQAQLYVDRKKQREAIEARVNPGSLPQQASPQVQVSNNPPNPGQMLGQAQQTGAMQ